jgi:hypothetical protein
MSEAIATINTAEVEQEVAPVVRAADALIVRNVDEHRTGLELLGAVMGAETKVKNFFKDIIASAMETKRQAEAHRQQVVALQDSVLAPVSEARKTISAKCAAFEAEERRVAELNQRALEAEARKRQEEQRELDAAMAETEEEVEEVLTEPLPPPVVPVVKPEVAKVAGVSTRETWGYEITDKAAFLAWAAKPENNFYATENGVALNSRARAEHDAMKIPGVKAVSTLSHSRR